MIFFSKFNEKNLLVCEYTLNFINSYFKFTIRLIPRLRITVRMSYISVINISTVFSLILYLHSFRSAWR